jgi:hypothetical protein
MNEKRQYPRRECNLKVTFKFFEGDPDKINIKIDKALPGKGVVKDMSRGGVFISSNSRVFVNMPIFISFTVGNNKYDFQGSIVRTGLLKNNPSELAQRYSSDDIREDAYIAVQFDEPLETIPV